LLQYLGSFCFPHAGAGIQTQRCPVFEAARLAAKRLSHPLAERRPESDTAVLRDILAKLDELDKTVK